MKRKLSLKSATRRLDKSIMEHKAVQLSSDPVVRTAELKLQGIAARVKAEGLTS